MQIVYRAWSVIDANLVRHALEAEGLHPYVSGEYLTGAVGELPTMGLVNVLLPDSERAAAERVLAEVAAFLSEPVQDEPPTELGQGLPV
jgi:Putative prokaryotic signal transducing protein